ncbi:hypothetical protein JW851_00390 [Candidatus Woesearchaeota archaeon]|nr:hypothetical protein [Candidatus Woesearchaeota archaeon]
MASKAQMHSLPVKQLNRTRRPEHSEVERKERRCIWACKAQMEILGLAIVVILIALALLFAVQFFLLKPVSEPSKIVKESFLAANFLNSCLGTSTSCFGRSIKELLQDCALGGSLSCPGSINSCLYSRQEIEKMLDSSLGLWKKDYFFKVDGLASDFLIGSPCPGEKEYEEHPVVVRPGFDILPSLEICS